MIYPNIFPGENRNEAEGNIFEKLSHIKHKYDIFYAKKFIALSSAEKPEYEIDFIICLPQKAIVCLEVKGGIIRYDGHSGKWYQNSETMKVGPDMQASSACHSLIKRYNDLSRNIPFGWSLCFPDCQIPQDAQLPPSINAGIIIDQLGTLYIDKALDSIFENLLQQYMNKTGCKNWEYEGFKGDILRGLGFVQLLGTRFKHDELRYIQLVEQQLSFFNYIIENKKIVVYGPAGSGKTIIAKTLAQELSGNGESILFLCFNRTLGNKISYETGIRNNSNILTGTFHSFAKRHIESLDANWWEFVDKTKDGFWDVEVPLKLDELLENGNIKPFDCLIIDEGQDFKEFWFELLFKLVKPGGRIVIFLDKMQDIFNRSAEVPNISHFSKFTLSKNCRNSQKIVRYLETVVEEKIQTENSPEGDDVVYKTFGNETEMQTTLIKEVKGLLEEHKISSDQIILILNSEKKSSSIASLKKIGRYELKSLDNKARFETNTIHYTSIETFKGLESDIVFLIDIHKVPYEEKKRKLYTEASRAKHKLFIYEIK